MAGGDVILFEGDDYIGGPVNLAARLADQADPNEVLASAELAAVKPAWIEARPVGTRSVPGFVQPVEVFRVSLPVTAEITL
jgi:class 3 adenylate cyclase